MKVLVEGGRGVDAQLTRLYGYRERMPVFALAYLHDALLARGGVATDRAGDLRRRMTNAVLPEAGGAHVGELADPYLLWFWNSNVRSTAIVLQSFVAAGLSDLPLRELVRWMMAARTNGRWGNTQENSYALQALVAYYRKYEATVPDFVATVKLGAKELARDQFRGRSAEASTTRLPMAQVLAAGPAGTTTPLTFAREGAGTLFYAARLRYAADTLHQQGLDAGFDVERRYEPFVERGTRPAATAYAAGDLVRVTLTFRLTKERRFVAVTDPLPAGFEAVESWFATTAADLAAGQDVQTSDDGGEATSWLNWWRAAVSITSSATTIASSSSPPASTSASTLQLHRPRHHGRHVPHRAGPRRGDVPARSLRPHGHHGDRGQAVTSRRAGLARLARRPAAWAAAGAAVTLVAWLRLGPLPEGLLDDAAGSSTLVVDRRGVLLYEALSGEATRSQRLTSATLPRLLVNATVAAEDRRFWRHPGLDPLAVLRAARVNLAEGRIVEGGSTLTQQVAKHLLQRRDPQRVRGVTAKLQEALVALRLEHRFDKREILALYLNLAPYGNQIAGAERASRAYFGVPAAMVTPAQAAFLAGLPQRPSAFNPYRRMDAAVARQRVVLRRMQAEGLLSDEDARQARADQLVLAPERSPLLAPHFVEMVLAGAGPTPGGRIVTTLDADLQADIAGMIESQRGVLTRHGARNVSVVVLDNASGEWLAWEGSGNYFDRAHGGAINGPVSARQPGSALKPFTYALAFEQGFGPASVLADVPSSFPTAEPGVVYSPRNYDGRYRGPMLARHALAGSENVPAVVLAAKLGVPSLLRFLARAGLTTLDKTAAHYGLGVTLGNAEVRLDQLVAAYAAFARQGEWLAPTDRPRQPGVAPRTPPARLGAQRLLDHRHPVGSGITRVRVRPRRQPGTAVPGGGQNRHVAGLSRQLDHRLFATGDGRRVGRQLRPDAAARFERRHRRRADLPRGDAGGRTPAERIGERLLVRADCPSSSHRRRTRDLRLVGRDRQPVVPTAPARYGSRRVSRGAVPVASSERRRPAHHVAARVPPVGARPRSGRGEPRPVARRRDASRRDGCRGRARASGGAGGAVDHRQPTRRRHVSHRSDAAARVPDLAAAGGLHQRRADRVARFRAGRGNGGSRGRGGVAARAGHASHRGARSARPHQRSHGHRALTPMIRIRSDGAAAALTSALAATVVAPYLLGWAGLALSPAVVAAVAVAMGLLGFTRAPAPAADDAAPLWAWLAVTTGAGAWLVWISWPWLLPPGGGSDLTHHLLLVDVLARTRHLVDGDTMGGALGEMAHYTPGLHLAIATLGSLVRVDAWRAAHPLVMATVALKAGVLFLVAHRLLAGRRGRLPLALAAVAFVLFVPRVYSLGGFLQSGYLAQVAAELFVVAGWWALAEWQASPRTFWLALVGACGAATFLVWPIWIGPLMVATSAVVLMRADLPVAARVRALTLATAPALLVAALHLSRHAAWLRMAGTSGAVPGFVPDLAWWVLVALAGLGGLATWRERNARATVWLALALAVQAVALVVVARLRGAETPYMAVKMTYLAAYPLAVLAAAGLAHLVQRLPASMSGVAGWGAAVAVWGVSVRLATAFAVPPPLVSPDLFAAGAWARAHVAPACVDYLVANGDTAYWLHLAVLGQPRDAARTAALDGYAPNAALGRWVEGAGLPYAVADRTLLPAEVRAETRAVYDSGGAVVIARRPQPGDPDCRP